MRICAYELQIYSIISNVQNIEKDNFNNKINT